MKYRPGEASTSRARKLRRQATDAEKALWNLLRENFPEAHFRRQVPIRNFIVDFASHRAKLVIEVDGGQHSLEADADRTKLIEAENYRLLRFWNTDVLGNPDGVSRSIADALNLKVPPIDADEAGRGGVRGKAEPCDQHHAHPTLRHRGGGLA